ncbi:hypothetical protein ABZ901_16975 [Actinacidiphila alni]|uniref:hypothetical protein n=1 Tax=Actinacidiphila alni TaxID=380248 RepID=UPI0034054A17
MRALRKLRFLSSVRPVPPVAAVFALACGLAWWWAVLGLAIRPDATGPWQSAMAAGGWSLGLIPLHAVPAVHRRGARRPSRRRGRGGDPPVAPTPGPAEPGRPAAAADDLTGDEGRGG